jgi:hypothetical protein
VCIGALVNSELFPFPPSKEDPNFALMEQNPIELAGYLKDSNFNQNNSVATICKEVHIPLTSLENSVLPITKIHLPQTRKNHS